MLDSLKIGPTTCDFVSPQDFAGLVKSNLQQSSLWHVVTLNPEMVVEARNKTQFAHSLNKAQIRVPDGAGIIWARWYLRSNFWALLPSLLAFPFVEVERVTGVDTVETLAKITAEKNQTLFLLGGTKTQNEGARNFLAEKFPSLKTFAQTEATPEEISATGATVLLVAFGSPKQTNWIENNRTKLSNIKIAIGVGGAFAILAEDKPRAPKLLRQLNLEWLWRLILEPKRIKRIYNATVKFPQLIHKQKLGKSGD